MENLGNTPSVILVDRFNSKNPGVVFTEDMLNWNLFAELPLELRLKRKSEIVSYISALSALMLLKPFKTKISIGINIDKKELYCSDRTWGEIYLGEEKILTFSHDSRMKGVPFSSMLDWPELRNPNKYIGEENYKKDWERIQGILVTWSVEDWLKFFKSKIKARAYALKNKSLNPKNKESRCKKAEILSEKILKHFK